MKTKLFLLFLGIMVMGMGLVGCTQTQQTATPIDNTPNHRTPWETGIASVTIGKSSSEVLSLLGPHDSDYALQMFDELRYYKIASYYFDNSGNIIAIYEHAYIQSGYGLTNIGQICVGSSKEVVLAAYGNPDENKVIKDPFVIASTFIYWKDKNVANDVELEINFFKDDTVHSIYIRSNAEAH